MGANHVLYAWLLMLSLITSRQLFQMDKWSWLMVKWASWSGCKKSEWMVDFGEKTGVSIRMQDSDKLSEKKIHLGLTFRFFRSATVAL